jgi:hypothetical protein
MTIRLQVLRIMLVDSLWFMSLLASTRIVRQLHYLHDLYLNDSLDVNEAANATGVVVVGASAYSVGAAGGWVIGGGHSSLSPQYGLGVDSAFSNLSTIQLSDGHRCPAI